MKKIKAFAAATLLVMAVSQGYAQEEDEVMVEDDSASMSATMDDVEAAPAPAEDESIEYSEEEY